MVNVGEFLRAVEAYYGRYRRQAVQAAVTAYLKTIPEGWIEAVYRRTLLAYSGRYDYPPDIAILHGVVKDLRDDRARLPEERKALEEPAEVEDPQKVQQFLNEFWAKTRGKRNGRAGKRM